MVFDERNAEINGAAETVFSVDAYGDVTFDLTKVGALITGIVGPACEAGTEENGVGARDEGEALAGVIPVDWKICFEEVVGVVGAG